MSMRMCIHVVHVCHRALKSSSLNSLHVVSSGLLVLANRALRVYSMRYRDEQGPLHLGKKTCLFPFSRTLTAPKRHKRSSHNVVCGHLTNAVQ